MALTRGLGAYDDGTPEAPGAGTNPIDVRKDLAGLVSPSASGSIGGRPGILPGAAEQLVSGTSGWAYSVAPFHVVTSRGASDGVQIFANDGQVSVGESGVGDTVPPAPSSGTSRIDVIWVRHPANTENGDTSSRPEFGVSVGDAQSLPSVPPIPAGALELARNTMSSGATSTESSGNSLQQTAAWTALRGTGVPVRGAGELGGLTPLASATTPGRAYRQDTRQDVVNYGDGWMPLTSTGMVGDVVTNEVQIDAGATQVPVLVLNFPVIAGRKYRVYAYAEGMQVTNPGAVSVRIRFSGSDVDQMIYEPNRAASQAAAGSATYAFTAGVTGNAGVAIMARSAAISPSPAGAFRILAGAARLSVEDVTR